MLMIVNVLQFNNTITRNNKKKKDKRTRKD